MTQHAEEPPFGMLHARQPYASDESRLDLLQAGDGVTWHVERRRKRLHFATQRGDGRVAVKALVEVLEQLAVLGLNVKADLHGTHEELADFLEVRFLKASGGHGRSAHAHATGGERGGITKDCVLVQCDVRKVTHLLQLAARQPKGPKIPQHQVVFRPVCNKLAALGHEVLAKSCRVLAHLLGVRRKRRGSHLLERNRKSGDLMVVRATLQRREHSLIDALLVVVHLALRLALLGRAWAPAEENHARARSAQGLVGGGGDHVAVLERLLLLARGYQSANVRHVHQKVRADLVRDGPEAGVVPVTRIGGSAADDHLGAEVQRLLLQLVVVDVARLRVQLVRQRLEEDRGGRDLLASCGVVAVGEMASRRKVKAHNTVVRLQQRGVHREVGWRARVRLHVHAPLLRVQVERCQRARTAQLLHLIHDLIAAVVALAREALGVLVREGGAQRLHHSLGGEVLGRNELNALPLARLFPLNQGSDLRVGLCERG
mmetsp:Transcript_1799/g.6402  ORF Transcript_1799/g.6402 Transcript_1799/m.6402 type:complete len:488 (-) Transcript_1799:88-1551(-)